MILILLCLFVLILFIQDVTPCVCSLSQRQRCHGLSSYNELLHTFYCLRVCDYKNAAEHVNNLDNSMKTEQQQMQHMRELYKELDALNQSLSRSGLQPRDKLALSEKQVKLQEQIRHATLTNANGSSIQISENKLDLAPPPLNGEWLPRNAVYALLDLMVATLGRPKGLFKECCKRIESGMLIVQGLFLCLFCWTSFILTQFILLLAWVVFFRRVICSFSTIDILHFDSCYCFYFFFIFIDYRRYMHFKTL